jgi:hypothetical protein
MNVPLAPAQARIAGRDLFLSHRATDKDLARRLAADIEAEGVRGRRLSVWLDEAEIPIGGSIPRCQRSRGRRRARQGAGSLGGAGRARQGAGAGVVVRDRAGGGERQQI